MSDPYRTPANVSEHENTYEHDIGTAIVNVYVRKSGPANYTFDVEGTAPKEGNWRPSSRYSLKGITSYITNSHERLREVLEGSHTQGFLMLTSQGIIIPWDKIIRIEFKVKPNIKRWNVLPPLDE